MAWPGVVFVVVVVVVVVVVNNFFQPLLRNYCTDFFEIWYGASLGRGLSCFLIACFSTNQRRSHDQKHVFMSSLCGVGVRVRVRVNNFSSKTTRPRDVLFFLKDTLSIEDEKLFKACKSVCSSVC